MRDRLIDNKEYARQMRENAVRDENGIIRVSTELWEQITDIIEQAIIPPCKVGDTVYWYGAANYLVEAKIVAIDSGAKARVVEIDYELDLLGEDFGKTVFLTKEEAEAHLSKPPKGE